MEDVLFRAFFDGQVFKPTGKIDLIPNRQYILQIKQRDDVFHSLNALDILDKLTGTVEAPEDWAVNHDHYLYSESYMKENQNNGERKNFRFIAD